MDWKQSCRARLPALLDANGDLAPPWARFPHYERYTIGWRMGDGEDWLGLWHVFLEGLDPATEVRLAYLWRHPPAPVSWADAVLHALDPALADSDRKDDDEAATAERRASLRRAGLIASDVAYPTWLAQQAGVTWPWEWDRDPETVARYWTRPLWFWSRQVVGLRRDPGWTAPAVPGRWRPCAEPLRTGTVAAPDPRRGLLTLARMLAAGRVAPPWELGLTPADFADTFDKDMGYVDAFRLWGMSAFDDREHRERYLADAAAPADWRAWAAEQFPVD